MTFTVYRYTSGMRDYYSDPVGEVKARNIALATLKAWKLWPDLVANTKEGYPHGRAILRPKEGA